ncbi:MAG: DNA polymerase III subunit delta [Pseudomonadota bacterium]
MPINAKQLLQKLAAPNFGVKLIWIDGDDSFLVQHYADALRKRAQQSGIKKRLLYPNSTDDWIEQFKINQTLSLFQEIEYFDIRWNGSNITANMFDALQLAVSSQNESEFILITTPRLSAKTLQLKAAGFLQQYLHVRVWPLSESDYKDWLYHEATQLNIRLSNEALLYLLQQTNGHPAAGLQSLRHLKMLNNDKTISIEDIEQISIFSAKHDIFGAIDSVLNQEIIKIPLLVRSLKEQDTEPVMIAGALYKTWNELNTLHQTYPSQRQTLCQKLRIFGPKKNVMLRHVDRINEMDLKMIHQAIVRLDRASKGASTLDPWNILTECFFTLAGIKHSHLEFLKVI